MDKNIVLIGMPGCGKSTIGKMLSCELNMTFCDIDECIEKDTGKSIKEIFQNGEEYFREIEKKTVEKISKNSSQVIATGGGVVKNSENIYYLKKNGIIIFINRPIEKIFTDVDILNRPLLKSGKEEIYKLYEERKSLYKKYCDCEIINDADINEVGHKIIAYLNKI